MAVGDTNDMARRMRLVQPQNWYPSPPGPGESETAPVLQGVLVGMGSCFSFAFQLLQFVRGQTRIKTASGAFLDMIAVDFFGTALPRATGETDAAYLVRIEAAFFPLENTRQAVINLVTNLTGTAPQIIELRTAGDTHGYGSLASPAAGGGYGYGTSGLRYGNLQAGGQFFVLVPSLGSVTFSALCAQINQTIAAGIIAWVGVGS